MRKTTRFGLLAASAVAGLVAAPALAHAEEAGDAKACYRTHCGTSIKGYEGQCGGTKVDGLGDRESCETAGGAWTTARDAEKYRKQG